MNTTHNSSPRHSSEIKPTRLGEQVAKTMKRAGVLAVAATAAFVVTKVGGETPTLVSASQTGAAMDALIEKELAKGPQKADVILNNGQAFPISPSSTVANAMIRIDQRAAPVDHITQSTDILSTKATTASVNTFNNEAYTVLPEDQQVVLWEDAELSEQYGQDVLLALPADQVRLER